MYKSSSRSSKSTVGTVVVLVHDSATVALVLWEEGRHTNASCLLFLMPRYVLLSGDSWCEVAPPYPPPPRSPKG